MDRIVIKDFRCFHEEQTARLAPLTLLVGENSTGKTSFMAMIRALWDVAYEHQVPDFKEDPYDLGSFDDIAHHRGRRGGRAETFEAAFDTTVKRSRLADDTSDGGSSDHFSVTFGRSGTVPIPVQRRLAHDKLWIEQRLTREQDHELRIGTSRGSWKLTPTDKSTPMNLTQYTMRPLYFSLRVYRAIHAVDDEPQFIPLGSSPEITEKDLDEVNKLASGRAFPRVRRATQRPYASAPVRSKPRRTYDPARSISDPEGDHVPMYLANMYFQDESGWKRLKGALESFGQSSGLFDEIHIKQLGKRESEPFQVQVRKFGDNLKGPPRNLIDVGYGVSQVLPVITELLRRDSPSMFLLQQPEVHLHPSAQAALGSLFCQIASPRRQLIVETHSDHLLDRVRIDIRDGQGRLKPDDVSILFFERGNLDVRIHSLRFDKNGNVLGAPNSYRKFFLTETQRSIGF